MPINFYEFEPVKVEYLDVTEAVPTRDSFDLIDERPPEDTAEAPSEEVTFGYTEVEWTY